MLEYKIMKNKRNIFKTPGSHQDIPKIGKLEYDLESRLIADFSSKHKALKVTTIIPLKKLFTVSEIIYSSGCD